MEAREKAMSRSGIPYRVYLPVQLVVSTDILPSRLLDTDDIRQTLDDGRADVHGEIGGIIMALRVPAFRPNVLAGLASVLCVRRGQRDRIEVEV